MKTEHELIQDIISMIQSRSHNKKHLTNIMAKYTARHLLASLDKYRDDLMEAEDRAMDYEFYNKYLRGQPDDNSDWEKITKEIGV